MIENITTERVVEELTKIVNAAGEDFTYTPPFKVDGDDMCYYVVNDEPSCIIGRLLHALGVPLSDLKNVEGNGAQMVVPRLVGLDYWLVEALTTLQTQQDIGKPWGEAFENFKRKVGVNA